nr:unnamed protein product [Digitaria exilis]
MEAQATETVKQALAALYHHPDDGIRTAADQWLQEFQHTLDAWQVADSLLHDESSNLETLIFCSQTLRSKVQRDFEELPSEAFRSLQDSLYVLLKKFNKGPPKVRTQICIAIAALAVHVPVEDWGAGGIVNWLSDEMKAHPEFIPGFLELLIVLPQETSSYKIAARPERRRQFESDLCSSANVAINLLTACMAIDQLKEQVLEGFSSWLRFCHGISASELASHPLVHMALSSLNSDQFLEAAVNVTSELIHATVSHGSGTTAEQMPLIQILVPHIMGLKEQLKDPSKDEEDVKAIARLFADMGESYVDLIATGSDDSIQIVNALLEVTSHMEFDISSMTFNFWHRLKRNLIKRETYVSYGSEVAIEAERNRRLQIFRPRFETLVSQVSSRVEYPEDYHTFSEEDRRDFRHVRYAVSDVLLDATDVLGGDSTLRVLSTKLAQVVMVICPSSNPTILCLSLPGGVPLALSYVTASMPSSPRVVAANRYIFTMQIAQKSLIFVWFLFYCLILCYCRRKFAGSLDGLFQIYHIAISGVGGYKVSSEDSLHLVEALSVVITTLPPESARTALELICQPVINPLQELIQQGDQVLQQVPARQLTVHIDRLSSIFRWRAWDTRTMESICRSCKFAVRTCGRTMGMTIGAMLEEIQTLYQQHKQSCFLYLSSEVIKDFTARPDIADDCYLLASRCIRYCPNLFVPTEMFQRLIDCAMAGITIQHREACKSILSFLSDVIDLTNSPDGENYREFINTIVLQRGATLTRIMIAAITGALPSGRLEEVSYVLLSLSRAFGENMLNWARESINLIPPQALTDAERQRFLNIISDAASGSSLHTITDRFGEISDVCRRNKTVQDLVQSALRPHDLTFTVVPQQLP